MAIATGQGGIVKVALTGDGVAAVGEVRSFSIETTADTIESTTMGDSARTYLQGQSTGTLSIEAYWDEADTNMQLLDERAQVDFELYPTGETSGQENYSGSGIVTSKSISASFDGMVEASFTIQISGAVTTA